VASYNASYRKSVVDINSIDSKRGSDLDFIHLVTLQMNKGDYHYRLSYNYGIEDREYYGNLILGRRQNISFYGGWSNALNDSVRINFGTEKLKFDSPDSLELSDRDRLVHTLNFHSSFYFLRSTRFSFDALVLLDHLVNLESQRSADNRWNRVFRVSPGIEWVPYKNVRNRAVFEVLANYTAYDFENTSLPGSIRSNVLRRWSASDTLSFPLNDQFQLEVSARYDLEDRGRLLWEEFKQELSHESRAYYSSFSIKRTLWKMLYFKIGYKSQRREEDQLERGIGDLMLRTRVRTYIVTGPFALIESRRWKNKYMSVEANLLTVNDSLSDDNERLDTFKAVFHYLW